MRPVLRQLPYALLATLVVVLGPPVAVTLLLPDVSIVVAVIVCGTLTLAISRVGNLLWRRRPQSQDVLFADLMLWGWVRRMRTERALKDADELFTPQSEGVLPSERRLAGLQRLTEIVESRDAYTHRHSLRVTRYSEGIARKLGLPEEDVARVRTAAALHDVGKFLTPREILNKPGRLTDEEFAIVKEHPGVGASLLAGLVEPEVGAIVRHHHERLSGKGYPDGLAGDAIPLGARIIAVADTFDAMTSTRAYRSARPHRRALAVLHEEAGTELDAGAVAAFDAYYSGRRGTWMSSIATAASQALLPLRDAVGPSVGRMLPALGASVAVTAPLVTAGSPAIADRKTEPVKRERVVASARPHPRTVASHQASAAGAQGRGRKQGGTTVRQRAAAHRQNAQRPNANRPSGGRPNQPTGTPAPSGSGGGVSAEDVQKPTSTTTDGGSPTNPQTQNSTPAPAATQAPASASTPAPTAAPEVAVPPVTVEAGGIEIETPPIHVDLPDLPIPVPTITVDLPDIHLP